MGEAIVSFILDKDLENWPETNKDENFSKVTEIEKKKQGNLLTRNEETGPIQKKV